MSFSDLAGVHTWTESRLELEVKNLLPDAWIFLFERCEDLSWQVTLKGPDEEQTFNELAPNIALLGAYSWLRLRGSPKPKGNWSPRPETSTRRVHEELWGKFNSGNSEDVPDLDPAEAERIYK